MKTKICVFLLILSTTTSLWAQLSINDYKYVSVPDKFDFLKSNDQYQLSSLTKFLLKKNGFTVLNKSDNYPMDLAQNNCLLLNANVVKIKGLLTTKLQLRTLNKTIHELLCLEIRPLKQLKIKGYVWIFLHQPLKCLQ